MLSWSTLRTDLTVRQLAAVFDVSKSQAQPIIDHLTPMPALIVLPAM